MSNHFDDYGFDHESEGHKNGAIYHLPEEGKSKENNEENIISNNDDFFKKRRSPFLKEGDENVEENEYFTQK